MKKLYIIKLNEPLERGIDWRLVRAINKKEARRIAAEDAEEFDEDPKPWLSPRESSCTRLTSSGEAEIVWRTNAGDW